MEFFFPAELDDKVTAAGVAIPITMLVTALLLITVAVLLFVWWHRGKVTATVVADNGCQGPGADQGEDGRLLGGETFVLCKRLTVFNKFISKCKTS